MIWLVFAALIWGLCVQPSSSDYGVHGWFWQLFSGLCSGAGVVFTAYCIVLGFTQIGVLNIGK